GEPPAQGQTEYVRDATALVSNLQRLTVIPVALADFAGDIHIGEEMHFDLDQAVSLAGLAAAALDVEGEPAGSVASHLGVGQLGEQLANRGEEPGVRRRIGARGAADGTLVDIDDLVDLIQSLDPGVRPGA